MSKIKILSIFGTRPEAIKMAPLVAELSRREYFDSRVAVTAQHRELLDSVLSLFGIVPEYDLNIMQPGQSLYTVASKAIAGLERVLADAKPDMVLVHGDTSTSFFAALAAYYAQIPVGHVEAGLRTHDIYFPFPEEINRRLIAPIAALSFCPTPRSRQNLLFEGVKKGIYVCGNTAIDAVKMLADENYAFASPLLSSLVSSGRRLIFMTAHRRENYGVPLENISRAVKDLAAEFDDIEFIYPVHPSPAVRNTVFPMLGGLDRIHLIEPLPVNDSVNLMARSYLVFTDSGGLQEEAPALGRPVVVLRNETERPEAIEAGTALLAGTAYDSIMSAMRTLLTDTEVYLRMARAVNPFGDGRACKRIADAIAHYFNKLSKAPEEFIPAR